MTTEKFSFSKILREAVRRNESDSIMSDNNNGKFFGESQKPQREYKPKRIWTGYNSYQRI